MFKQAFLIWLKMLLFKLACTALTCNPWVSGGAVVSVGGAVGVGGAEAAREEERRPPCSCHHDLFWGLAWL